MGNIHSVNKALQLFGAKTVVTNKPGDIRASKKVVLPGVGAFEDAMLELEKQGLISALTEQIRNKKPFLGICLGMQLLFQESEEAKGVRGLGILRGRVKRFVNKRGFKIPHMGWNQLKTVSRLASERVSGLTSERVNGLKNLTGEPANRLTGTPGQANRQTKKCPLLKDIPDNSYVYFCHSYYSDPRNPDHIASTTEYSIEFASIIWQDNVYGVQFHPEKSQAVGLKILKNFVEM